MNESYKEQHPLLCDDLSDVEHFNYNNYQRRLRPMVFRSRSAYKARAAGAIITQWPNHWSSAVTYWWIGIGMMVLTILIIYNSIVAFALFPVTDTKPTKHQHTQTKIQNSTMPEIFMHIFVDANKDVDFANYLPYVDTLSVKYPEFKYNIFIVINDTNNKASSVSEAEHNKNALKTIMSEDSVYSDNDEAKRVSIKYRNLSHIMNRSAIHKKWRHLSKHFIEFLVRAISIWEDGGITLNPMILTQHSRHQRYIDKLHNLLKDYRKCSDNNDPYDAKSNHHDTIERPKKKVNNIRDIIDILEHDGDPYSGIQTHLTEAESVLKKVTDSNRKLLSIPSDDMLQNHTEENKQENEVNSEIRLMNSSNDTLVKTSYSLTHNESTNDFNTNSPINKTNKINLLPLFLDFIFHDKDKIESLQEKGEKHNQKLDRKRKSIIPKSVVKENTSLIVIETTDKSSEVSEGKYKPMVIKPNGPLKDVLGYNVKSDLPHRCPNKEQLTIDLNGNILATQASCHAFLGTVFSNIDHHIEEESVHDVIIAELSVFCKGLLSSCKGIDLILL